MQRRPLRRAQVWRRPAGDEGRRVLPARSDATVGDPRRNVARKVLGRDDPSRGEELCRRLRRVRRRAAASGIAGDGPEVVVGFRPRQGREEPAELAVRAPDRVDQVGLELSCASVRASIFSQNRDKLVDFVSSESLFGSICLSAIE